MPECVQPDHGKWARVNEGMPEAEARKLLGEPLFADRHETATPDAPKVFLRYGRIRFASPALPDTFDFDLPIREGKVYSKHDPFGGELSKDGRPTAPLQITPYDRTTFDHYPRFVDLRWRPSSGEYPIAYVVEVEFAQHERRDGKTAFVYVAVLSENLRRCASDFDDSSSTRNGPRGGRSDEQTF